MKVDAKFRKKLIKLKEMQNGVLTSSDLWTIISPTSKVDFYRQINKLIKEELIKKVCRGFYIGSRISIPHLIMSMRPSSYLSLEYVLSYYNMIGTYTDKRIRPILPKVVKDIKYEQIYIEFKTIKSNLVFDIDVINGIRMASREKAFLDTLYFYQKGLKFSFDIYSDIDITDLDKSLVIKFLNKYNNPKFIIFVKDYLND